MQEDTDIMMCDVIEGSLQHYVFKYIFVFQYIQSSKRNAMRFILNFYPKLKIKKWKKASGNWQLGFTESCTSQQQLQERLQLNCPIKGCFFFTAPKDATYFLRQLVLKCFSFEVPTLSLRCRPYCTGA